MITFSNEELMDLLAQDVPFLDNTTFGLGIEGQGEARFYPKDDFVVLCGIDEAAKLAKLHNLHIKELQLNGAKLAHKDIALLLEGDKAILLKIAKTIQNLLEYSSSVATYTYKMKSIATKINPNIAILGTRKTMPFAKKILLKALISGGGIPHRYGLSDSVLVFAEHLLCVKDIDKSFKQLKDTFKEHKIIVEIDNIQQAMRFAKLGADILQCEKMQISDLKALNSSVKAMFPHILISATGGINIDNIASYAESGVDMIVSTSMYRAPIIDFKVEINPL